MQKSLHLMAWTKMRNTRPFSKTMYWSMTAGHRRWIRHLKVSSWNTRCASSLTIDRARKSSGKITFNPFWCCTRSDVEHCSWYYWSTTLSSDCSRGFSLFSNDLLNLAVICSRCLNIRRHALKARMTTPLLSSLLLRHGEFFYLEDSTITQLGDLGVTYVG